MALCILSPPTNASLGITFINSIMLSSYVNCRTIHSCLLTSQRQLWIVQTKAVLFCFGQSRVLFFNPKWRYFPRGSMLKNPPCNAGEAGLIPGPRAKIPHASCMLGWHYWAWTLWSPCATSRESGNPNERSYVMQCRSRGCNWDQMESNTLFIRCSVAQSCPTLCDPMDCSTPGLPVLHRLPGFVQTHVH